MAAVVGRREDRCNADREALLDTSFLGGDQTRTFKGFDGRQDLIEIGQGLACECFGDEDPGLELALVRELLAGQDLLTLVVDAEVEGLSPLLLVVGPSASDEVGVGGGNELEVSMRVTGFGVCEGHGGTSAGSNRVEMRRRRRGRMEQRGRCRNAKEE